ncbi:MAG: hypothetical protein ABI806_24190 [Candidatus Solibacter sp.]
MNKLLGAALLAGMMASAYGQADVRDAVRWEHAKERAAARQAAIGRGGETKAQDGNTASEPAATPARVSGVQAAISYERFKEAAAARQARIEARGEKSPNTVTASGRGGRQ